MDNLDLPAITDIEEDTEEKPNSLEITSPDNLKIDLDKKTVKPEDIFVAEDVEEKVEEDKEEQEEIPVKKTKRRPLRKKREKLKPNDSFMSMTEAQTTDYPESEYTEAEPEEAEPKKKKFQVRNPQKVSERRQRKKQEKLEIINRKKEEDEQIYYRGLAEMELDRIVSQQRNNGITSSFQPRKLTKVKFTEEEQQEPMKEPVKEPVKPMKEPVKPIQKASKRQIKQKPKTITKKPLVSKPKTIEEVNPYEQYF